MGEGSLACATGVHQSMNRVILAKQTADLCLVHFFTDLNMEYEKLQMFVYIKVPRKEVPYDDMFMCFNQSTF